MTPNITCKILLTIYNVGGGGYERGWVRNCTPNAAEGGRKKKPVKRCPSKIMDNNYLQKLKTQSGKMMDKMMNSAVLKL